MTTSATVLVTAAAFIWLAPLAVVAGCYVRDRLEDSAEQKLRAEEMFLASPTWLAVVAAIETPAPSMTLYDQISLEFAARDLTDESLARAVEGWK